MGRLEDIVNADSLEALERLRAESGVDEVKSTPIQRAVSAARDRARQERASSGSGKDDRDYVRDPIGQFARDGHRDSQGGKDDDEPSTSSSYTVKPGDTLSEIAERELGDADRWREIRDASGLGKDFDPTKLQIGTKLELPPKDGDGKDSGGPAGEGGRRRTADAGIDRDGDGDSDPARGKDGFTRVGSLEDVDRQIAGWTDNIKPEQRAEQRRRLLARARELGASDRTLERIRNLAAPDTKGDDVSTMQTKGPDTGVPADLEHKTGNKAEGVQVLETDDETGIVVALVSVTGVVDNVKDQIEPGAYTKTMATREPIGVWSHDDKTWVARTEEAVELHPGDPFLRELKTMDGKPWDPRAGAVKVTARFNLETPHGAAAYSDVKFFKGKTGWSIGYRATKAFRNPKTGVRHIKELDWFEYSPVMVGAASQPMTLSVKSLAGAYAVDADDDTGLADEAMLEELTLDELDRLDSLKASLGLEVKARVRTAEGAQRYGQPIGSVIVPDAISGSLGAKEITRGMSVEFQGMGPGGPSDPKPVKGTVEKVARDGNITTLTVNGEDHKLVGNSPVAVTGGRGGGKAAQITDRELVTMLQEAEDDDERKLIKAAAALPADKRRAFLTSGGKNDGSADTLAKATDKPDDQPAGLAGRMQAHEDAVDKENADARSASKAELAKMSDDELFDELTKVGRIDGSKATTDDRIRLAELSNERHRRAESGQGRFGKLKGKTREMPVPLRGPDAPPAKKPDAPAAAKPGGGGKHHDEPGGGGWDKFSLADVPEGDSVTVAGKRYVKDGDGFKPEAGGDKRSVSDLLSAANSAAGTPSQGTGGSGFVRQNDGSVNPSEGRGRDGMKGAGTGLNEHSDPMAMQGNTQLESFIAMTERMVEGRREAGDEPWGDDHEVMKMLHAAQDELAARKKLGVYSGDMGSAGTATTTPRKRTAPGEGEAGDLTPSQLQQARTGGPKPDDAPPARAGAPKEKDGQPANEKGENVSDFVNAVLSDVRDEEYRQMESELQHLLDEYEKDPTSSARRSALVSMLKSINEDGIDAENVDDALELLQMAAYGGTGKKADDLDDLEGKGSRASLDRSPRANWVENAGELPGYIREVARAIEREQGLPLSRAIAIAIGRIKKWARGGGGVNADTVAKAAAAVAAWEALKAKNAAKYDSELLEHIETKALERIDLIEQLEADGLYAVELKMLVDDNADLGRDLDDLGEVLEAKSAGIDDELIDMLARGAEVKGFSTSPVEPAAEDDEVDFSSLLARRAELG